jgi:hypothetical protein
MKIFISYSSQQIYIAKRIKEFLDKIEMDSFLASDDIRTAEDWKERIIEELETCQIIIPILSKEFKKSDWCSQEIGIFSFLKKDIIPISIDGTSSYGFIRHIQSNWIEPDVTAELRVAEGLVKCINDYQPLISLLKNAGGFRYAENIFKAIEPYFDKIGKEDINLIINYSIENSQIWGAAKCIDVFIPKLLKIRKYEIDSNLIKKITYQLENQKWYSD